ncbi:MAG: FG-GAP-like repeat-containing protein [Kofleriaceae bacterium]
MNRGWLCAIAALVVGAPGCGGRADSPVDAPGAGDASGAVDTPASVDAPGDAATEPTPRLIAPLSMASVTQQRPTLRWVLDAGGGTPVVDLCLDRACTRPIAVATELAANHRSAVPVAALPVGWVYWRVRVARETEMVSSRTWQFWVGRSSASTPVDTSNGTVLDVNGDGYPDILVGAADANAVHVYLGSATAGTSGWNGAGAPARIDLLTFGSPASQFGTSVASAGDVNGDGYADFLVGSPGDASFAGAAYLYLGSATPSGDGWNGIAPRQRVNLTTPAGPGFGRTVATAGDVDGDGYADFLVSGFGGYDTAAMTWLYLGSARPDAVAWNDIVSTRRIALEAPEEELGFTQFGNAMAGVGDLNGDGYADFVVGAWGVAAAFVYLGSATISEPSWNADSSTQRIDVTAPGGVFSSFGLSIASAGDVNGDGYADFLVGDAGMSGSGLSLVHLYLGSATASAGRWNPTVSTARIDLSTPDGAYAGFGDTVASAGDVNGDGYADFLVGASFTGASRGVAHLYLGSAAAQVRDWTGLSPSSRIDLTSPDGDNARFGSAAAGVGDVNGDGYVDFVVGADAETGGASEAQGAAHLYLGTATPDATRWNEAASTVRRDLTSPDGAGAHFGNAVADRRAAPVSAGAPRARSPRGGRHSQGRSARGARRGSRTRSATDRGGGAGSPRADREHGTADLREST